LKIYSRTQHRSSEQLLVLKSSLYFCGYAPSMLRGLGFIAQAQQTFLVTHELRNTVDISLTADSMWEHTHAAKTLISRSLGAQGSTRKTPRCALRRMRAAIHTLIHAFCPSVDSRSLDTRLSIAQSGQTAETPEKLAIRCRRCFRGSEACKFSGGERSLTF